MATKSPIDPELVRELAELLNQTDLTEIEITEKDQKLRVARTPAPVAPAMPAPQYYAAPMGMAPAMPPQMPAAMPASPAPAAPVLASDSAEIDPKHPGLVTSPMVGVAYLLPEPGAAPFITQGQKVSAGQTLLLIEAMKTFNQIKAPRAGTVTRILVENGTPVEYGEPLVVVE